jgi:ABC-type sugar transport system substrate-binding protein
VRARRYAAFALIAAAFALVIGAANGAVSQSAAKPRIAFFATGVGSTYLNAAIRGAKQAAAGKATMDVYDARFDPTLQLSQLEDVLANKHYDGWIIEPVASNTPCKVVRQAIKRGVRVAVYNSPLCGHWKDLYMPGTVGYFGDDMNRTGGLLVSLLASVRGGKGEVAHLTGTQAFQIVQIWMKGVDQALKKHRGMSLSGRAEGAWDPTKAGQAVEDILQAHPDISGFILDGYPDLRTLKILGRANVKVVVQGGSKVAFQQVRKGLIAGGTVAYPSTYTANTMTALLQVLRGKKVAVPGWNARRKVYDGYNDPKLPGPVFTAKTLSKFPPADW